MRRITILVLVFILVVVSATPCHAKKHHARTHVRYATGTIYKYDMDKRLLYIETSDGNLWAMQSDCIQSNRVRVKFDTMGTRKIEDDRIIKVSLIK